MRHIVCVFLLMCAFTLTNLRAEDRVELQGTSIIGNRELPKVLYIIPWKKPNADNLMGNPVASLVGEALDFVDRDVFRRQVEYYDHIKSDSTTNSALKE